MNIIFMGTPEFALPSLSLLLASDNTVTGVVTQPDRPKGRGKKRSPSPVKTLARQQGLPLVQPETVKEASFTSWVQTQHPDLIVVVAFGQILPPEILGIPVYGCINLHASLLPRYRGAAPINWPIIKGEETTGVTTIFMNEGMDRGDIILQRETKIAPTDDALTLSHRLSTLGAKLLLETISRLKKETVTPLPQDHAQATYAPLLKKEDGHIDWKRSAGEIHNQIRGTLPWPGAFTRFEDKLLKIFKAKTSDEPLRHSPGTLAGVGADGITVATGKGYLVLTEVQSANRRKMTAAEFLQGTALPVGSQLG